MSHSVATSTIVKSDDVAFCRFPFLWRVCDVEHGFCFRVGIVRRRKTFELHVSAIHVGSASERSLCRSPDKFSLLWNFAGDQLKLSRPWLHHGAPTYCTHVYCHLSTVHTVGHGYFLVLHVFDLSSSMENPCFCSRLCSVIYYSSYTLMQNGSWPGLVAGFIVLIHIL